MARSFVSSSSQYLLRSAAVVTTEPFTISAWFYPTAVTTFMNIAGVAVTTGTNTLSVRQLRVRGDLAGDPLEFQVHTGTPRTANSVNVNQWNHGIGLSTSNSSRSVILNGGTKATNTGAASLTNATNFGIGGLSWNNTMTSLFDGNIAEVGVWNVALSDAECTVLSTGVSPLFVRPLSLVAYYPLLRDNVGSVFDNTHTLTEYNSPGIADHPRIFYSFGTIASPIGAYVPPAPSGRQPRAGVTMLTSPIGVV